MFCTLVDFGTGRIWWKSITEKTQLCEQEPGDLTTVDRDSRLPLCRRAGVTLIYTCPQAEAMEELSWG